MQRPIIPWNCYDNVGDHQEAIRDYDRAIDLDPKFARAYVDRGVTYDSFGTTAGNQRFQQGHRADPKFAWAYNCRGVSYDNLGDHQQAIRDFNRLSSWTLNLQVLS